MLYAEDLFLRIYLRVRACWLWLRTQGDYGGAGTRARVWASITKQRSVHLG